MLTSKANLATYCQKSPIGLQSLFFHTLLKDWVLFEACSPNSGLGNAQQSLETAALAILA